MKRLLGFVLFLAIVGGGGTWAAAEYYFLPKQEEVWRGLLADLPEPLEADFEDLNFSLIGMRATMNDFSASDGAGSSIDVEQVVAENSVATAMQNLLRQAMGREEEAYDVVRFINVRPREQMSGSRIEVEEIRIHNVRLGIDQELPAMVKSLTGEIGLDKALEASSADGVEILGLNVEAMGGKAELGAFRLLDISESNLGLGEISGLKVSQQGQTLGSLDVLRLVNFNLAAYVDMEAMVEEMMKGEAGNVERFNLFHTADEITIEGLEFGVPGLVSASLRSANYKEAQSSTVAGLGIVPTRITSDLQDYFINFAGAGVMSPEFQQFMDVTEITSVNLSGDSNTNWDLDTATMESSGGLDVENLLGIQTEMSFGNISAEGLAKSMALPMQMVISPEIMEAPESFADAFAEPMEMMATVYEDMELNGFVLSLEDKSLTRRLMKYGAVMSGMTEKDLNAQINGMIDMVKADPSFPASLADDAEAIRSFVNEPGTLTLTLAPAEPVKILSLGEVEDPNALVEQLGLSITAK